MQDLVGKGYQVFVVDGVVQVDIAAGEGRRSGAVEVEVLGEEVDIQGIDDTVAVDIAEEGAEGGHVVEAAELQVRGAGGLAVEGGAEGVVEGEGGGGGEVGGVVCVVLVYVYTLEGGTPRRS